MFLNTVRPWKGPERVRAVRKEFSRLGLTNTVDDMVDSYRLKLDGIKFVEDFIADEKETYKGEEWIQLKAEFHEQVANFMRLPLNRRWNELMQALENPEAFLTDVTIETVELRERRDMSGFGNPYRLCVHRRGEMYVSHYYDIGIECQYHFELLSDRAIDILVALSILSDRAFCCKIYCTVDGDYTIGNERSPLFRSPESASLYFEEFKNEYII